MALTRGLRVAHKVPAEVCAPWLRCACVAVLAEPGGQPRESRPERVVEAPEGGSQALREGRGASVGRSGRGRSCQMEATTLGIRGGCHSNWTPIQSSEFTSGSRFVNNMKMDFWKVQLRTEMHKPLLELVLNRVQDKTGHGCDWLPLHGPGGDQRARPPMPAGHAGEPRSRQSCGSYSKDVWQGGGHCGSQQ